MMQPPQWGWEWALSIERRVTAVEIILSERAKARDAEKNERPAWTPRDYMMAASGAAMVIAALSEKVGWTTVIAALVSLLGGK